eukprot:482312-Amphidinium_carterae.4
MRIHEAEYRAIADHVKIATVINHLKGPIKQHLMLKVTNTTQFDEVHCWISNYSNSIYIGGEAEDKAAGGIDDQLEKKPHDPGWPNQ